MEVQINTLNIGAPFKLVFTSEKALYGRVAHHDSGSTTVEIWHWPKKHDTPPTDKIHWCSETLVVPVTEEEFLTSLSDKRDDTWEFREEGDSATQGDATPEPRPKLQIDGLAVKSMRQDGKKWREIAASLGCSKKAARAAMRAADPDWKDEDPATEL